MEKIRALIDTNILLIGSVDLEKSVDSPEAMAIKKLLTKEIKMVTSLKQLEEIHVVARRVLGKSFAGWLRYLLLTELKPIIIREEAYSPVEAQFRGKIPEEDSTHFAVAVAGKAHFLVSENREFLKKASKCRTVKCVSAQEFLKELKLLGK